MLESSGDGVCLWVLIGDFFSQSREIRIPKLKSLDRRTIRDGNYRLAPEIWISWSHLGFSNRWQLLFQIVSSNGARVCNRKLVKWVHFLVYRSQISGAIFSRLAGAMIDRYLVTNRASATPNSLAFRIPIGSLQNASLTGLNCDMIHDSVFIPP